MMFPNPSVVLITGIMASGKSTVAQALAERLPVSVHLRGDSFRRMIVNGRVEPTPENMDAAFEQLRLRYRIAESVAEQYCAAGFTVVYQDVIIGEVLNEVVYSLRHLPLYVVVLCPAPEVAGQRDAARAKTGYGGWTPHDLDRSLREETPRHGLWLDNSALTDEETDYTILASAAQARVSGMAGTAAQS